MANIESAFEMKFAKEMSGIVTDQTQSPTMTATILL